MKIFIFSQNNVLQSEAYLTKEACISTIIAPLDENDKEEAAQELRRYNAIEIGLAFVQIHELPINFGNTKQIDQFKVICDDLLGHIRNIVDVMPNRGLKETDSQKIALLNACNKLEANINGTEQEDLVNVFTCKVSDDFNEDAEPMQKVHEIIRVFDEKDYVVFFDYLYNLPHIFDGEEIDIELFKKHLISEDIMKEDDILEGV